MARIDNSINNLLSNMHSNRGVDKGSVGEQAVFKICEKFYRTCSNFYKSESTGAVC